MVVDIEDGIKMMMRCMRNKNNKKINYNVGHK